MTQDERWYGRVRRMARTEPRPLGRGYLERFADRMLGPPPEPNEPLWPMEYQDWLIEPTGFYGHPKWKTTRFTYFHKDYDGPEDDRHGHAPTIQDCMDEIDEYEEVTP